MIRFIFDLFYVHGRYFPMVIIQVLDETCKYVVGVVDLRLVLILEIFSFCRLNKLLLEDIFGIHHLAPLFRLGHMILDPHWDFC